MIFISFFDEVSNFRNRILTNQKHELVVSNCQWNGMTETKRPCVQSLAFPVCHRID